MRTIGTREPFHQRIHRVHDRELERVEDHQRADGIDAEQVHERLDDDRIHPAARIVTHLLQDGGRTHRLTLVCAA